jgi:hypothetical protein
LKASKYCLIEPTERGVYLRLKRNLSTLITWVTPDSIQVGIDTIDSFQISNLPLLAQAAIDQADGIKNFNGLTKNSIERLINSKVLIDLDQNNIDCTSAKKIKIEIQFNSFVAQDISNILSELDFLNVLIRKSDPINSQADLLILFGFLPINLQVPHLVINFVGESILIGPLVIPKQTSCLNCLYLHRKDLNKNWSKVALRYHNSQPIVAKSLIYQAAISAASSIINYLNPQNTFTLKNQILELNPSKNFYQIRELVTHPSCGCKW